MYDIIDLLWDPQFQVRSNAAIALGKIGDTSAIESLASKLLGLVLPTDYDDDDDDRPQRVGGPRAPRSWHEARMQGCPPESDSRVRSSIVEALGMIQDDRSINIQQLNNESFTVADLLAHVMFYDNDQVVADKAEKALESLGYSKFDINRYWIEQGKLHASRNNYKEAIRFLVVSLF